MSDVGEPTRRSCWILSRTPTMDDATYDAMLTRISEAGYPEGCMKRTKQVWEEGASRPGEGATKRDGGVWWLKVCSHASVISQANSQHRPAHDALPMRRRPVALPCPHAPMPLWD